MNLDRYEATKLLEPHLESIRSEVDDLVGGSDESDQVQALADALSQVLGTGHEIETEIVGKFWAAVDWRLLADMYLGIENERST